MELPTFEAHQHTAKVLSGDFSTIIPTINNEDRHAAIAGAFFYARGPHRLGVKDTIVLADFDNHTGDPVFDGTLKQALDVALHQSPSCPSNRVTRSRRRSG